MNRSEFPLVSIVTVNYHQDAVTGEMLDSLRKVRYPNVEIILVNNGAGEDHTALFKSHHPDVKVLTSRENLGFAGGTNLGIRHSQGQYILLLNNDTIVPPDFLEPMVDVMEAHPQAGIASPKIFYHDIPNVIQYAGATSIHPITGRGIKEGHRLVDDGTYGQTKPTALGNGACMLVRRQVFEETGLLSELYFMYYEEHDFCERARLKGWDCYYVGQSYIHHRQSMTMGRNSPLKTYYLFRNRWLYMRRINRGSSYYLFLLYFLFVGVPRHMIRHLRRREFQHAGSILRGIAWNILHPNIHHHETTH